MFEDRFGWYVRISAYWFATSFKWFLALLLLPAKVNTIMPQGEQNSTWGMILAIGAAEATFGPALMGWLSDRMTTRWGKRRPWIVAGALLTCVACAVLGSANTVPMLIFGYFLLQVSDDVATGPYSALIPEFVPSENRGRASGILGMLNYSAQIIAAIFAMGGTLMKVGHSIMFAVIALLHIVCMIAVVGAIKDKGEIEETQTAETRAPALTALFSPFKSPNFRVVWSLRFLVAFGFYIISAFGQNYLKDVVRLFPPLPASWYENPKDGAVLAATVVIVLMSSTGVVGALVGGRYADKVGRKKVIQTAGWIMFMAILPFALMKTFPPILLIALVFGFGYGAFTSADWALVADVLPNQNDIAKDMGIWQSSIALPQIFNGILGAQIDRVNASSGGHQGYLLAFGIAAFLFLAGSWVVGRVKLPSDPKPSPATPS
ncbi:MAG: MFS transporter [Chthonomonas sp.]|nr:MFS transporter [Chthonomonas sp.]